MFTFTSLFCFKFRTNRVKVIENFLINCRVCAIQMPPSQYTFFSVSFLLQSSHPYQTQCRVVITQ